jgi:hypothetical protein
MTLFFNILLLEQDTQCNPKLMVEKLKLWYSRKRIPKNYATKIKPLSKLFGDSFLLNPQSFFEDQTTDIIYKSQYLQLAGRRNYSDFVHFGATYLDLTLFQDVDLDKLKTNPLLTIANNKIYFKYEGN